VDILFKVYLVLVGLLKGVFWVEGVSSFGVNGSGGGCLVRRSLEVFLMRLFEAGVVVAVDVLVGRYLRKDNVCGLWLIDPILVDCGIVFDEDVGIALGVGCGDVVCGLEDFLLFFLEVGVGVRLLHEKLGGWDDSILFGLDLAIDDGVDLPTVYFEEVEFLRDLVYFVYELVPSYFVILACLLPYLSDFGDFEGLLSEQESGEDDELVSVLSGVLDGGVVHASERKWGAVI
jgi:hypothetical protein